MPTDRGERGLQTAVCASRYMRARAALKSVDRHFARRLAWDDRAADEVLHRGASIRRKWLARVALETRRLMALFGAIVRSMFAPADVDDDMDLATVDGRDVIAGAPPPSSAFTLAIVTSPIIPAAPPRPGALV